MCCLIVALGFYFAQTHQDHWRGDFGDGFSPKISVGEFQIITRLFKSGFGFALFALFLQKSIANLLESVALSRKRCAAPTLTAYLLRWFEW